MYGFQKAGTRGRGFFLFAEHCGQGPVSYFGFSTQGKRFIKTLEMILRHEGTDFVKKDAVCSGEIEITKCMRAQINASQKENREEIQ
jgi:hypothetical protein